MPVIGYLGSSSFERSAGRSLVNFKRGLAETGYVEDRNVQIEYRWAEVGNPAGRLRGSRNRLSEAVICALLRDFEKHGEKAIARVREENPAMYLKVFAMVLPRQHKVEHTNPTSWLSS